MSEAGGEERGDERKVVSYVGRRCDDFAVALLQLSLPLTLGMVDSRKEVKYCGSGGGWSM